MEEINSTGAEFGMGEKSVPNAETGSNTGNAASVPNAETASNTGNDASVPKSGSASNTGNAAKPLLGMKFNSDQDAYNYYNSYALVTGFGIRKSTVNYHKKTGVVVDKKYVCDKEGFRSNKDKAENPFRRESRVGCKAMLRIKLLEDQSWEVTGFIEEHNNHALSSPDKAKMHRSHQQVHKTPSCKQLIESLQEEGMAPSTISRVINATSGREGELVTPQQCIDHIRTLRHSNIGHECMSIIKNFQSRTGNDPEFYFSMEVDSNGQMRSVFWADGRSRSSYLQFNDVLVFDVTYRTNKFSLPFAPFTGVNHHRQSILLGCALLADEQEETFVWLFEEWLKCMHGVEPGAIITDQDRAMCNAIHAVFPTTRHRYCHWHMQKHIIEHLPTYLSRFGLQFQSHWDLWCNSSSITQCEGHWLEMKKKFDINEEGDGWLQTVYKFRGHWVPCYLKDTFFAGMRLSQRSESINSFFDGFVNSQTRLDEFVTQYEKGVTHRRITEAHEDFKSLTTKPVTLLGHPIEIQAGEAYTRSMFHVFQTEFKGFGTHKCEEFRKDGDIIEYKVCKFTDREKWEVVAYDQSSRVSFTCTCALFETNGVVCRHILSLMVSKQMESLPNHYILHRWTIHARHHNIGVSNIVFGRNITSSSEKKKLLKSWALRAKFNIALEKARNSDEKIQELDDVLTSFIDLFEEEAEESSWLESDIPQVTPIAEALISAQIAAPGSQTMEHIPQITIRDPKGPARTKGRPRNATRIHSALEQAHKPKKQRFCGNCRGRGHYRSSCKINLSRQFGEHS